MQRSKVSRTIFAAAVVSLSLPQPAQAQERHVSIVERYRPSGSH